MLSSREGEGKNGNKGQGQEKERQARRKKEGEKGREARGGLRKGRKRVQQIKGKRDTQGKGGMPGVTVGKRGAIQEKAERDDDVVVRLLS